MILHLTGSCPENAFVSDFSGDISIPKLFCYDAWSARITNQGWLIT
jgi:hypothetical protein